MLLDKDQMASEAVYQMYNHLDIDMLSMEMFFLTLPEACINQAQSSLEVWSLCF
jgi:hypothetical protein